MTDKNRQEIDTDFATTPRWATEYLLDMETFSKKVYEPCCGTGAISEVLKDNEHDVVSTDIKSRGYGAAQDLFSISLIDGDIITNPPFSIYSDVKNHLIDVSNDKVALLSFLRNIGRDVENKYGKTLKAVYILGKLDFPEIKLGWKFAWFVWQKDYAGNITVVKEPSDEVKRGYMKMYSHADPIADKRVALELKG